MTGRYTLEIRERGRRLSHEPMPDPFHNTTIHPRGWRAALDVLLHRYTVTVIVGADAETVERVMELDPDYLGLPGSPSREAWNAQLHTSLENFAKDASSSSGSVPPTEKGS